MKPEALEMPDRLFRYQLNTDDRHLLVQVMDDHRNVEFEFLIFQLHE